MSRNAADLLGHLTSVAGEDPDVVVLELAYRNAEQRERAGTQRLVVGVGWKTLCGSAVTTSRTTRLEDANVLLLHRTCSAIAALGVGPRPLPRSVLSAQSLATALRNTLADNGMRGRATVLDRQIGDEDGIATAVEIIGRRLG
jgi:hypothetical protein